MRKTFQLLLMIVFLWSTAELGNLATSSAYAYQPDYAKWGSIAMEQTSARYHAEIIDYLHVGRTQVKAGIAEEKFKLWLKDSRHEFGVFVTIQFYTSNDQIITVKFQETAK